MSRPWVPVLLTLAFSVSLIAQAPTGTIAGTITDESGAVVPNATITITNKETAATRTLTSGSDGSFNAAAMPAGVYEVRSAVPGFRTIVREATVETGATTTVDLHLQVGQSKDIVTVEAVTAQVEYDRHNIDGVINRQQIQELPLNGRSFLNLAFLEPGVTVSPGTTSQRNALFSISILGGDSSKTAITVDGGNIRNSVEGGSGMNFSQEVVQEFQLSSANFDLSTGITSVGAVNIVTRSGSNDFHGAAYFFFRDHNMAAYPGLARNPLNPNPFFARRNPGVWIGGPIKKDRLFFFFNFENINQTQAFIVQPDLPSAAGLAASYGSPYKGKTLSARFDYRLSEKNQLFARYSHDGNTGLGPNGNPTLPSNWLRNTNWSDQSLLGVTTTLRPTLVNDFRFNYQYWHNRNLFPTASDCPGCVGLGFPQVSITGTNVTIGDTSNATQGRDLRRYEFNDSMNWQKGRHGIKFGFDIEHAPGTGFWGYCDPACDVVASPELVRASAGPLTSALFPNLPKTVTTNADFLNLPFLGGVVGIGDPSQPPPYNIDTAKVNNRYKLFVQDTWKVRPRFTLNYGLSWSFESTLVNSDLSRPAYLAPIYGSNLSPTNNNYHNFSPALGFAWTVDKSAKTVIRGGAGIYYDTESLYRRLQERSVIGPVGNGRVNVPNTAFTNIFPGIVNLSRSGAPIAVGAALPTGELTTLTLGQFNQILAQQGPAIAAARAPKDLNDLSVRGIDINKSGAQLYLRNYPVQQGIHTTIGVQRQLFKDMVLSVDYVRRVYNHVLLDSGNGIDLNLYSRYINGVRSPVIPACTPAQATTPKFECSTGPIQFWVPGGHSVYNAMLVKLDKRFANRLQFTASYALTSQHGYASTIFDLSNWSGSYGPLGPRHILNVSGIVDLPWGLQFGFISTTQSVSPVTAYLNGVDLSGNGNSNTTNAISLLPGIPVNGLNRGYGKADLEKAVASFNGTYAGKKDARGLTIPAITLPSGYSLGRAFNSQDIRLTKMFVFKERYRLQVFGEGFNIFNITNLSNYQFVLGPTFGQPTQRQSQVFGSGGPRAFQIGGRFSF